MDYYISQRQYREKKRSKISCFFTVFKPVVFFLLLWNVQNCGGRRKSIDGYDIYTEEDMESPVNRLFFVLLITRLVQGRPKTSNYLSFYFFIEIWAFARLHLFFVFGSYTLSTSVSLFLHVSSTFTGLCLLTSLFRVSSIIPRHSILLNSRFRDTIFSCLSFR